MIFKLYVEEHLAPSLSAGDIVILDNLSSHKAVGVREIIEAKGASLRFLPPYSPDLNPIEQAISKIKAFLRKAAARTFIGISDSIATAIDTFSHQECANLLANSGYA